MRTTTCTSTWTSLCLALALLSFLTPAAHAQKNGTKYREFPALGFEFKPLKDFSDVPVIDRLQSLGIVGQMEAERGPVIEFENGDRFEWKPSLKVLFIGQRIAVTGEKVETERDIDERETAKDFVMSIYGGGLVGDTLEGETSELKASNAYTAERVEFTTLFSSGMGKVKIVFDVYTFLHRQGKAIFIWDYPADNKLRQSWGKVIEKSMKSFQAMKDGADTTVVAAVNSDSSYEDLIAYHRRDVMQTPGWRLVETPTKQYLIKTNAEDDGDIQEVIQRLEASRALYEKDFPPAKPITSISVVRVCASESDFHAYGQTGGGVAGWFNPGSEELVLYFGEGSKESTLSVMAHEGFHQYCHFLFGRAEAHRWFDEGHGDYYGAWRMKGKQLVQEEDMRGGLARVPELREMSRNQTIKPLSAHIRYDHGAWQTQGPTNVSCYAQSFGLVYFLREGANGNLKRKYWKEEWAEIIPNYMAKLNEGYESAYEAVREEGRELLERLDGQDPEKVDPKELEEARNRVDRPWDFAHPDKQAIWNDAINASWGLVNEDEFEQHWLDWVENGL